MKKQLVLFLALALCLGLTACGGTMPSSSSSGSGITVFGDIDMGVTRQRSR